jgi:uncharacterized membrane protein
MRLTLPQIWLDRLFRIGVVIKGIDGTFEVLGALVLFFVPLEKIKGLIETVSLYEIQEDGHRAFIANMLISLDQKINTHVQLFAAIYLLLHGLLKLALAYALIKQHYHLYPYAIAFLVAFVLYQAYLIGYNHSLTLTALTLFDCTIAWLTYLEWKRHGKTNTAI